MIQENNSQKNWITSIFVNLILLIVVGMLIIAGFYLYNNVPRSAEIGNVFIEKNDENFTGVDSNIKQFYPQMKFNHNDITYKIDFACDGARRSGVVESFDIISSKVSSLSFREVSGDADIEISCSGENNDFVGEDHFIAGEGGAKEIIPTGKFSVISEGVVYLYETKNSKTDRCNYPHVELHELMHVFGFDHNQNEGSLMNPVLDSCNQVLDVSIVNELNRLYAIENLPDLHIEDVSGIKNGIWLTFNLTVRNSGVVDAKKAILSIFDERGIVETMDLNPIDYGAGIIIGIENLKLNSLKSREIEFKVDVEEVVEELDEENNGAKVSF